MAFLNGYKSYFGFIGYGVCHWLAAVFPEWAAVLTQVADYFMAPLAGVGLAHKLAKM